MLKVNYKSKLLVQIVRHPFIRVEAEPWSERRAAAEGEQLAGSVSWRASKTQGILHKAKVWPPAHQSGSAGSSLSVLITHSTGYAYLDVLAAVKRSSSFSGAVWHQNWACVTAGWWGATIPHPCSLFLKENQAEKNTSAEGEEVRT